MDGRFRRQGAPGHGLGDGSRRRDRDRGGEAGRQGGGAELHQEPEGGRGHGGRNPRRRRRDLDRALAPKIRVNAICPGYIDTRWFYDAFGDKVTAGIRENIVKMTPLKAASKAEDIADAALFLISDAARHVTGETLMVDAGLHL